MLRDLFATADNREPQENLSGYCDNFNPLLATLIEGGPLSAAQVAQLKIDLAPDGPIDDRLQNLNRILELRITNERDTAITKVLREHEERISEAQWQLQGAEGKREALNQYLEQRYARIGALRSQIARESKTLLVAVTLDGLHEEVNSLRGNADVNLNFCRVEAAKTQRQMAAALQKISAR